MRSRPGPERLRDGTEDRSTGPIEGTYGLHQGGSDRSEAPSATIVQGIRSIKDRSFIALPRDIWSSPDLILLVYSWGGMINRPGPEPPIGSVE